MSARKSRRKEPPTHIETEYGYIQIEDTTIGGEPVRYYRHNGAYSSGTFLREEKKYELLFEYPKKYEEAFRFLEIKNALMIGGAAYQYPQYNISHHDGNMDVVEIAPLAEQIAREWFFLEDLYQDFDLYSNHRLNCITANARDYLASTDKVYDVVFNDAFTGSSPVPELATLEAATAIREHLIDGGIYMSNIIGSTIGKDSEFLKAMVVTTKQVFRYVHVLYTDPEDRSGLYRGNYMVLATDREVDPTGKIRYHSSRYDTILTDATV